MVQPISAERTLILPEYNGQTPGLSFPLIWPSKDPNDANMDFSLDVSGWCVEIDDTVRSFQVGWTPTAFSDDLVVTSAFAHNNICTIITAKGRPFIAYTVTLTILSTTYAETLSRNITLPVQPRYSDVIAALGSVSGVSG